MVSRSGVQFITNVERLKKRFGGDGTLHRLLGENLRTALKVSAEDWERKIKRNQFAGYRGQSFAKKLQTRSGALRRSMRIRLDGQGFRSRAIMFSNSLIARIHEEGGVIRGKPFLSIPFSDTLVPSGAQPKAKFRTIQRGGKWVTSGGVAAGARTYIRRSKAGNLIVFANIGRKTKRGRKSREPVGLRILKRSVKLPSGRLGFTRTWRGLKRERSKLISKAGNATLHNVRLSG